MDRGKIAWASRIDEMIRSLSLESLLNATEYSIPGSSESVKAEIQLAVDLAFYLLYFNESIRFPGMRFMRLTNSKTTKRKHYSFLIIYLLSIWALNKAKYKSILEGIIVHTYSYLTILSDYSLLL